MAGYNPASNVNPPNPPIQPCKNCGACPTCGRPAYGAPYWGQPYYVPVTWPSMPNYPYITWGGAPVTNGTVTVGQSFSNSQPSVTLTGLQSGQNI